MESNEILNSKVLYVDNEKSNLENFKNSFENYFNVLLAYKKKKAIDLISKHEIKVLIFNVQLSDKSDIAFIDDIKLKYPEIVCILVADTPPDEATLSSIKKLNVFSFVIKPWAGYDMKLTIENAIAVHCMKKEQQNLQQELQVVREKAMESDRLKSVFISNISHELRTPLNGIIGFISLFEDNAMDIEKLKEYKRIIDESSDQFLHLIDDLLVCSQLQSGTIENLVSEFDLVNLFKEIYNHYRPLVLGKDISFSVGGGINEYDLLTVKADKAKLHKVFHYLLNNALKFTNSGYIEFGIQSLNKNIFYVKDTGIGVSKDKQRAIFQAFRQESDVMLTRDYGGCGLGLSIVKGLIEVLGGEIWIESEKNKGSTFFFRIPFEQVVGASKKKVFSA